MIKYIDGGVCAPAGFKAAGVACGLRKNNRKDLALIVSETPAAAAGTYTSNLVKGAPLLVTKQHLQNGYARAVIVNSGNANTCNPNGVEIAEGMCALVEKACGISAGDVVVASTGVIGKELSLAPFESGIPALVNALGDHSEDAATAILTTDTRKKEIAAEFTVGGKTAHMGAIAKGSGMICPNMATMLAFITTDAAVSPAMLQKALSACVKDTFNMISVDRDTSTNDMAVVLANGMAGNDPVESDGPAYEEFSAALHELCLWLCREMARDGEGATKLLECRLTGAATEDDAKRIAKSVICSTLLKCAMFGADANWGRVLCAIGYAGPQTDVSKIAVAFRSKAGSVDVCAGGAGLPFSEEKAKKVLSEDEIVIEVTLGDGNASASAFGCDLSYDYVRINGDYRT